MRPLSLSLRSSALAVALAGVILAGSAGCSLGDRQAMANRVIEATKRAERAGSARATVSLETKVIKGRVNVVPGPPRIVAAAAPDLNAVLDFRSGRSAVGVKGDDPSTATMLFDGTRVFERRGIKTDPLATAAGAGGAAASAALTGAPTAGAAPAPASGATTNLFPLVT